MDIRNGTPVRITTGAGQVLLSFVNNDAVRFPEKLGDAELLKFGVDERAEIDRLRIAFREEVMRQSQYRKDIKVRTFGRADNWEFRKPESISCPQCQMSIAAPGRGDYHSLDPEEEVVLTLNQDAQEGAFWTLLLLAHPGSPYNQGPRAIADIVLPIIRQIDQIPEYERYTGLEARKRRNLIPGSADHWKDKRKSREQKDTTLRSLAQEEPEPANK